MSTQDHDWLGLKGQVCVVTGAAGGIGKAIADSFAAAGAQVAYLDMNGDACLANAQAARDQGFAATGLACDVSRQDSIDNAAAVVSDTFGPAGILVNNAAILRPGALEDLPVADWELMLRVNLTGALMCAQTFGKGMIARGRGALVHIASIAAANPQAFSGAYSPGKAAIAMLSRQLAFEWGPKGVRSNSVSPGMIRTPLSESFYQVEGILERREAVVPVRRIGQPQDIADATLFLASPRAAYVNGQDLTVDGGFGQTLMSHIPRPGY